MNVDYHLIQSPFLFLPMIFHHVYEFDHQYITQVNLDLQTSVNNKLISYSLFDDGKVDRIGRLKNNVAGAVL